MPIISYFRDLPLQYATSLILHRCNGIAPLQNVLKVRLKVRAATPISTNRIPNRCEGISSLRCARKFSSSNASSVGGATNICSESETAKEESSAPGVKIMWKLSKYCPDCGKYTEEGKKEPMAETCAVMWRKYMRVDDKHCPMFLACKVKDDDIESDRVGWRDMPRLKGRS